jgi:hypothetical protein
LAGNIEATRLEIEISGALKRRARTMSEPIIDSGYAWW